MEAAITEEERVLGDAEVLDEVSRALGEALGLGGRNRTLGRKFIGLALEALRKEEAEKAFLASADWIAVVDPEILVQVLNRVDRSLRSAREPGQSFGESETLSFGREKPSEGGVLKFGKKFSKKEAQLGLAELAQSKKKSKIKKEEGVSRSGLGLDAQAWERPVRLDSSATTAKPSFWNPLATAIMLEEEEEEIASRRSSTASERGSEEKIMKAKVIDEFEAAFYEGNDDSALAVDADAAFLGSDAQWQKRELEMARSRVMDSQRAAKKYNPKKSQLHADQAAWEENRMLTSGVAAEREARLDFSQDEQDDARRVHLLVHQVRPPFLFDLSGGNKKHDIHFGLQHSKQQVAIVKDPTSDMVKAAKTGSALLRSIREKHDRTKMRQRFWEVGGSRMGAAIGLEAKRTLPADESHSKQNKQMHADEADRAFDYRAQSSYASHAITLTETTNFKDIESQRQSLPVYTVRQQLLTVIRENQIVVVVGETGSGKTTQMTQYLLEDGYAIDGMMIGCTQPRRVAAMSVAQRVAHEQHCELGTTVGYAIRFEDCTSSQTQIKYMTDGVLLREALREPDLDMYSAIVMDEAHERSLHTDVLLGILRQLVTRRRDLKLIVTSATLDAKAFSDFFGGQAPVIRIPGRTFPVEKYFAKTPCDDYVDACVKQVLQIHLSFPPGDILVFMTGQEDIQAICTAVADRIAQLQKTSDENNGVPPLLLLPMYSQLPAEVQAKIFKAAEDGVRKCVVSTNVAETSLTVDGIKYVVDCGYCKLKVYNPRIGMDALQVTPVSRANAAQRAGRAGRTAPGFCYRLYTERQFREELLDVQVPEIQRTNLGNVVLLLKSLGVDNLLDFSFMDPPPKENILASMYQLWVLGALDNNGRLSDLGKAMADFPLDPPLAKMLLFAAGLASPLHKKVQEALCSAEALTVVSALSVPTIFYRPKEREEESDAAREKFFVPESDHLTLLNVYQQWRLNGYDKHWCETNFIQDKAMSKVREIHAQLLELMESKQIPHVSCDTDWDQVRRAISSAYFFNAAKLKGVGEYVSLLNAIPCNLHPSSALYGLGYTPDFVCYHELVLTSKEYMKCTTAVDGLWLAELGSMFFSVKETYADRIAKRKRDEILEYNMAEDFKDTKRLESLQEEEDAPPPQSSSRSSWRTDLQQDDDHAHRAPYIRRAGLAPSGRRQFRSYVSSSSSKIYTPGAASSTPVGENVIPHGGIHKRHQNSTNAASSASSSKKSAPAPNRKAPIAGFM